MIKRWGLALLLFQSVCVAIPAYAADEVQVMTAVELNLNAVALSTTPVSNSIPMDGARGFFNQLTMVCAVTWGTSTQMEAKCKGSYDDSVYGWVDLCTGANPKVCSPLEWQWPKLNNTDGLITLELRSNYKFYQCQLDDAGAGSGTAICTVGRGRQ